MCNTHIYLWLCAICISMLSVIHMCMCCVYIHISVKCCCSVSWSHWTLCDPMDCSSPGSSVHGISQARLLEWVVISFSMESSQPRDQTYVSSTSSILYHWATREASCTTIALSYFANTVTPSRWKKLTIVDGMLPKACRPQLDLKVDDIDSC